ncbi:PAAR domain-containing protein [Lysobacter arvi]|uniref:PAAR domain-containing protein n=1 Tax=Lysobacter arvi TaxID=3038776 RepID=A0ABU1CGA9_9GAMM|nr:PAAR domain-containing protein [Lysobacter arvi]MDR0183968.1 PAAR domain-containing protein [Lysobacter arvi]
MAQKYVIVVGDSTTAGGEAIEGDPGWNIEGLDGVARPLVRVNNTVICGQCGPTKVVQGAALLFSNGALAAYDGCVLACGHQMVSTKQRLVSVDVADASPLSIASRVVNAASSTASSPVSTAFDEGFQFIDAALGKPLVGLECVLLPESAADVAGTLGDSGCSLRCGADSPIRVAAAIEAPSPLLT